MKYVLPMVVALLCFAATGYAQEAATETAPATQTAAENEAVQRALAPINHQRRMADGLYATSITFGLQGTTLLVLGALLFYGCPLICGGFEMLVNAGPLLIGHILTMVIGMGVDFGSGSRRRKLLREHPELALSLTPGPGDAGLGFALHF